jgi:DNA repair exonuclease SbcCD ATPase subunit
VIKFKKATMRNFMSFGNNVTTIDFNKSGTTLITGENLDDGSNGKNGVGKSCIGNLLLYVLYDQTLNNVSKDNLINNINKKNLEATIEFDIGSDNYHVYRSRKTKAGAAGNTVVLRKNGIDITQDSVSNTNKMIEKIIGIPYEMFVRIVLFSATNTSFLDLPAKSLTGPNQTEIIEHLFDLTTLTHKADALKDQIKINDADLQLRQVDIAGQQKQVDQYQKMVRDTKQRVDTWSTSSQSQLEQLTTQLQQLQQVDPEKEKHLHSMCQQLEPQITKLKNNRDAANKEIKQTTTHLSKLIQELEHLNNDQCPYCLQTYPNSEQKKSDINNEINEQQDFLSKLESSKQKVDIKYQQTCQELTTIKQQITIDDIDDVSNIKEQINYLKLKIAELSTATNPHQETLDDLLSNPIEEVDYTVINKLQNDIDHQKFLLKLLTKKDSFVRKTLLEKNIPYLNSRLDTYLEALGLPHKVQFTHELTVSISYFGRELEFGGLSAGQKARVNFALTLAFRDVLQRLHTKINICVLDEILDVGLDSIGVENAVRLLKRKARDEKLGLFIITHRSEISNSFDNILTVQMSNGFSHVKINE